MAVATNAQFGEPADSEFLRAGALEIRVGDGLVIAGGEPMTLSVREFELLRALALRTGSITAREALYREVWGRELKSGDRSVDVYVSRLREKLSAVLPDWRFIHTHPGFGYRFQPVSLAPRAEAQPDGLHLLDQLRR